MDYFDINKDSPLAIYGFSNIGKEKINALLDEGYNIACIIDKNANQIKSFKDIQVFTLDDFCEQYYSKENIIIVCLNNGMQHEDIALKLIDKGYDKILYIPMNEKKDYEFLLEMQKAYFDFSKNKFNKLQKIPCSELQDKDITQDIEIISKDEDSISFLCDIEYLYSPDLSIIKKHAANETISNSLIIDTKYVDIPIVMCKHYINLYDYIMGKVEYPYLYLDFFGRDSEYNKKLIEDRISLFACYEKRYNVDKKLFFLQPAMVVWNEKGYFNVSDGIHRLLYLYYVKNIFRVPITTSYNEFEKYKKYHKNQKYIYKTPNLIFQEEISRHMNLFNACGAIIDSNMSEKNNTLINLSKQVILYDDIQECISSGKIYDYIAIDEEALDYYCELINMCTQGIVVKCSINLETIIDIAANINIKRIGIALKPNFEKVYIYILKKN